MRCPLPRRCLALLSGQGFSSIGSAKGAIVQRGQVVDERNAQRRIVLHDQDDFTFPWGSVAVASLPLGSFSTAGK